MRFLEVLRCPKCRSSLELRAFAQREAELPKEVRAAAERRGIGQNRLATYVEEGVLLCGRCKLRFPVAHGLPVMLPYVTPLHRQFDAKRSATERDASQGYRFADDKPVRGEELVARSFSTEWLEYDYDGVIWELTYEAHAERILREIGPAAERVQWYLEVGCGLGIATSVVQEHSDCDAVGLDLSLAALKAAQQFKTNPFMHFVQASAFAVPLAESHFDVIYSRGALHHTYSTERAFKSVARHSRAGGTFYVWLYGPRSIRSTPLRVGLYALEAVTRPWIARAPAALPARTFLGIMALAYVGFNRLRRFTNSAIQPLSFARGIHAARDRFTPRFAHRHSAEEILKWFADAGFKPGTVLDWREMPPAEQEDFSRNVGVRAIRAA